MPCPPSNNMEETSKFVNYSTLQQLIDKLISRHGTEKTYDILKRTLHEKNPSFNQDYVIANIIANTAIEQFKISISEFKSGKKNYGFYARASCFCLIRTCTRLSYRDIRQFFNENITNTKIRYAIKTINDILALPILDREIYDMEKKHEAIVNETIKIIL